MKELQNIFGFITTKTIIFRPKQSQMYKQSCPEDEGIMTL
jgi:hypothetical protein